MSASRTEFTCCESRLLAEAKYRALFEDHEKLLDEYRNLLNQVEWLEEAESDDEEV